MQGMVNICLNTLNAIKLNVTKYYSLGKIWVYTLYPLFHFYLNYKDVHIRSAVFVECFLLN